MRVLRLAKLIFVSLFLLLSIPTLADESRKGAEQFLPNQIGDFHATGPARSITALPLNRPEDVSGLTAGQRIYASVNNRTYTVNIVQANSEAGAYALLTSLVNPARESSAQYAKLNNVGTAALASPTGMAFFKGSVFVTLQGEDEQERITIAQALAARLEAGSGQIPALIAHLPNGNGVQERAVYAVSLPGLQAVARNQPVLDAVSFEGGAEAVTAKYDQGQLVIVEFQTPQLASDTDARVGQRIAELRAQNQPVPLAYRRVGNYAVFVFDAPDEQAANALIDKVHYEKVVQWLGEDPHRNERANRYWLNMSGSLIVNTVKATGLAILLCLGIGGLFGGVVFMRRRAQAALNEQYSDAGGMMRLNLDEFAVHSAQPTALPPHED